MSEFSEKSFLNYFQQNATLLMWFLGAGVSRSAGMPTATDIIWDLKRRYYCLKENQDFQSHNTNNQAIKRKIQEYMDSKGFSAEGSPEEYSFYFDLTFGKDYDRQQTYINDQLAPKKISLNIGHRVMGAFLEMGLARVLFSTNFDEVIETAFSSVTGKSLSAFHLEGSYAALDALNAERFPIYAKVHGDFRYKNIKNLSDDLVKNDAEIQKCFLAASTRYGVVVSGYSGRDANVMAMFRSALEQNNAFPKGLFWTTPRLSDVAEPVTELITQAKSRGIRAHIVESGTFDTMMLKMWRQLRQKSELLESKILSAKARPVKIPLPQPGKATGPILRINALPILEYPRSCGSIDYAVPLRFGDFADKKEQNQSDFVLSVTDRILFWGVPNEVVKILDREKVKGVEKYEFEDPIGSITSSTIIKGFFEEALARAICSEKPLLFRERFRTKYAVVDPKESNTSLFTPLKTVLGYANKPGQISGAVPGVKGATWAEALFIKLEEKNGALWLLIRPDIWIEPGTMREAAVSFIRSKKTYRYNPKSHHLLNAWIQVLFGTVGAGESAEMSCFSHSTFPATFTVSTRSAFSRKEGAHE
ncbi:MAG: SIR2 family protein [Syntrophorhabdales bacterium]